MPSSTKRKAQFRRLSLGPVVLLCLLALAGCSKKSNNPTAPAANARHFRMGMTPFPAKTTIMSFIEAVDFACTHGDVVSAHHDGGVPWDSALAGRPPTSDIVGSFTYVRDQAAQHGVKTFVSVTWLTNDRDSIATGWEGSPRPSVIESNPRFGNLEARRALKYWCAWAATTYQPDRFAVGIEINFYATRNPADWPNLVSLYREVYDTLKTVRPSMQVFPTWQLDWMDMNAQWGLIASFEDKMDALALSFYPGSRQTGSTYWTPSDIPADYIGKVRGLTGSAKPMLVSETGYGDSTITPPGWQGSRALQQEYATWLFHQADSLGIQQVIWFFNADIWDLVDPVPPPQRGILPFFASMGLRTRTLASKPVLTDWDAVHARPYSP